MELDWLETFLAVIDQGGFTAASEHIHRSQSRVSAHIAGLERALGVQLIDRHRRPAALTDAGLVLSRHARAVLAELAAARSAIDALRSVDEHTLVLLTTPWIGAAVLPQLLPGLLNRWPSARLSVVESGWADRHSIAASGAFSIAILPALDQPLQSGLHERVLWRDRLQVVVPAEDPLANGAAPVAFDTLAERRVLLGAGIDAGSLVGAGIASEAAALTSTATLVELVRNGVGSGLDSAVAIRQVDTAGLAVLDVASEPVVDVAVYWHDALPAQPMGRAALEAVAGLALPPGGVSPVRRPESYQTLGDQAGQALA